MCTVPESYTTVIQTQRYVHQRWITFSIRKIAMLIFRMTILMRSITETSRVETPIANHLRDSVAGLEKYNTVPKNEFCVGR